MFPRRYLRRSLVLALLLPIALLGLFALYQNRHVIFSEDRSHHHDEDHSHLSHKHQPNNDLRHYFNSKRLSTIPNIPDEQQIKNFLVASQTLRLPNAISRDRQMQVLNPIQQIPSSQFGTPVLPVIETKNLQRFVHLDLKGAAPKLAYLESLFPYLKQLGATGLVIEYEDMFPFTGRLANIRHGLAYSKSNIQQILELAERSSLKVMPLLQVYGHLEYVLKLKEFMHLREDKRYPQVITPCLDESYKLLFGINDFRMI